MSARILLTYATRNGSTVGVAEAIGEQLGARGFRVDVKPAKDGPSLDGYDAVVMGSAVNGGQWLPEAVALVTGREKTLSALPVALFCVHIMNTGEDETSAAKRRAYLDSVRSRVRPVDEAYFAGVADVESQAWPARFVYRTFKLGPEGDCRDWEKIRGWADALEV